MKDLEKKAKVITKRHRSPIFPYFSLKNCVQFSYLLYKKDRFNKVPVTVALSNMRLLSTSSTSRRALSSLLSYKLLDSQGSGDTKIVWLSDLGKRIVLEKNEDSPEKLNALREAALNDEIFYKVWTEWHDGLPSEKTMIKLLQLNYGFNERAAIRFASVVQSNFEYAHLSGYHGESESVAVDALDEIYETNESVEDFDLDTEHAEFTKTHNPILKHQTHQSKIVKNNPEYSIPLIGGGTVSISGPFPLNQKNYDHVMAWFELMKTALIEESFEN